MDVIGVICILLSFVVLLLMTVGLFKPSTWKNKKTGGSLTRKTILIRGLVGFFVLFVIGGLVLPDPERESLSDIKTASDKKNVSPAQKKEIASKQSQGITPTAKVNKSEVEKPQKTKIEKTEVSKKNDKVEPKKMIEKTTDLTLKQFVNNFNNNMTKLEMPYRARTNVTKGSVNDVSQTMLNDRVGITIALSKNNGKVKSVSITANGDGTQESGAEIMLTALATFSAISPDVAQNDMGKIVSDLISKAKTGSDGSLIANKILNDMKFSFFRSEYVGNMFSAAPR